MSKSNIMNQHHLVIDLETVDKRPTAGILSIGARIFVPEKVIENGELGKDFYVNVDVKSCIDKGMTFTWDTIYWWMKQEREAGESLQYDREDIAHALPLLSEFIYRSKSMHIWGNPNKFDISILENAYKLCGIEEGWGHKEVRDLVTLEGIIGQDEKDRIRQIIPEIAGIKHNALYDCDEEVYRISEALRVLLCQT